MKLLYLLLLAGMLGGLSGTVAGQNAPAAGGGGVPVGWLKLSSDAPLAGPWHLYSELEARQANSQMGYQYLGRVGVRRYLGPSFALTAGYVLARNEADLSHATDLTTTPEHRFYQEVAVNDADGAVRVSHRLRVEERWLRPALEAPFRFAPRLRYQLRLVVPLARGGRLPVGAFYVVAADELFASLGQQAPRGSFLEENRASAGLGRRLSSALTAEVAYLHQSQQGSGSAARSRNALQLSVGYAVPVRAAAVRR